MAKLVHFNIETQKSYKHSEELMTLFREIYNPLNGDHTFEERVVTLKQSHQSNQSK